MYALALSVCAGIIQKARDVGNTEESAIMEARQHLKAALKPEDLEGAMADIRAVADKIYSHQAVADVRPEQE